MRFRRNTTPRPRTHIRPKMFPLQQEIGQKGINLIERIVLDMGCIWNATGAIDVGIDGTVQLCDRATRSPLNLYLHVQSRATESSWEHETDEGFDYTCRPQDLDYWLKGNAPVLLIVSRPSSGEAYWVSIKDYFKDPARRLSRRIHFEKQRDQFTPETYPNLFALAARRDAGLYLASVPKAERLISNLLEVSTFASRIYVASTPLREPREVWAIFREVGVPCPSEWVLKGKRILSFHDLTEYPWDRVCERGTVEDFASEEWAFSDDPGRRREFVQLLNGALKERLFPEVRFWHDLKIYAFTATKDLRRRVIRYPSGSRQGRRAVFEVYKSEYEGRTYTNYRHLAMEAYFRRYDGTWFLEITPSYIFTRDGRRVHRRHSDLLFGIKLLEKNAAVRQQLLLWASYLQHGGDLFSAPYPYLSFGRLREFVLDVGISNHSWRKYEESSEASLSPDTEDESTDIQFEMELRDI